MFRREQYLLAGALLLLMLAQMVFTSSTPSAAFDKGYTVTYGYAYLRMSDARLSRGQNSPSANIFIALPLPLRDDVAFPIDHSTWGNADIYGFSDEFLWRTSIDRATQLVWLARLPVMADNQIVDDRLVLSPANGR